MIKKNADFLGVCPKLSLTLCKYMNMGHLIFSMSQMSKIGTSFLVTLCLFLTKKVKTLIEKQSSINTLFNRVEYCSYEDQKHF